MDWSATLSLKTSHARQHRSNYGSFSSSTRRLGSSSSISIPPSIPEHQCVVQFTPPTVQDAELQVVNHYDVSNPSAVGKRLLHSSGSTVTITETTESTRLNTFKLFLTNPAVTAFNAAIDASQTAKTAATTLLKVEDHSGAPASSYWLQERERMLRDRRSGSPTKGRVCSAPSLSNNKTLLVMCSVPLVLLFVFIVAVFVFGDGSEAIKPAPHVLNASTEVRLRGTVEKSPTTAALHPPASPTAP